MEPYIQTLLGLKNLFVKTYGGVTKSITPGLPPIGTTISFLLISIFGIVSSIKFKKSIRYSKYLGVTILIIGSLALLGHLLSYPLLYSAFQENAIIDAIPIHGAILQVLYGLGILLINIKDKKADYNNAPKN